MAPPGIGSSVEEFFLGTSKHPSNITVLDGGFATQLGCHVSQQIDGDVLWSSRFLHTNPEAVIRTHMDFLNGRIEITI